MVLASIDLSCCTNLQNFSDSVDNTSLQELFSKFGDVISCKIVRNEDGIMGLFNLHRKNQQMQQFIASTTPISVIGNCTFYVDLL
jgi:hypothetical protein